MCSGVDRIEIPLRVAGSYYNFDSSSSSHHDSVMSDQLAGHWFLKASHVPDSAVRSEQGAPRAVLLSREDSAIVWSDQSFKLNDRIRTTCSLRVSSFPLLHLTFAVLPDEISTSCPCLSVNRDSSHVPLLGVEIDEQCNTHMHTHMHAHTHTHTHTHTLTHSLSLSLSFSLSLSISFSLSFSHTHTHTLTHSLSLSLSLSLYLSLSLSLSHTHTHTHTHTELWTHDRCTHSGPL